MLKDRLSNIEKLARDFAERTASPEGRFRDIDLSQFSTTEYRRWGHAQMAYAAYLIETKLHSITQVHDELMKWNGVICPQRADAPRFLIIDGPLRPAPGIPSEDERTADINLLLTTVRRRLALQLCAEEIEG